MKHLFNQFLSVFLVLTMVVSGSLTSLASDCTTSNYSYDFSTETEVPFEEEISIAQNAYAELSPEAKVLFENSLLEDPELLAFHRTYVDSYFTVDTSMHRAPSAYAVSASNPLSVLSSQLNSLGLPTAVVYSLKALGASMAAALADGPLPAGCLLYTSPSPRDVEESRMPSSA